MSSAGVYRFDKSVPPTAGVAVTPGADVPARAALERSGPGDVTIPDSSRATSTYEHFAGDASPRLASGGKALLRVAVEASFSAAVQPVRDQTINRTTFASRPVVLGANFSSAGSATVDITYE
jgi:hypothetical protein